uniref:Cold shock domain-containing protein n=1 Tax=Roseihalotalea indica TaxID=2867963 RepID=A0AA49JBW3_9BACT|nr:cold shock domain-containing protein [Tunicatimonas sp. TK19036]
MAKSQDTFSKKEKEKKRLKKRQEKQQKREERKEASTDSSLENMMAYVDENGNLTDTPPDPAKKKKVKAENIVIGVPKKEEEDTPLKTGRVEFFNDSKGFGFIKEVDSYEKYFVHVTGLAVPEIKEGDLVTFELEQGPKGMNAVNVKK